MNSIENWMPVPGWEGIYSVSDHGRIKRIRAWKTSPSGNILKMGWSSTGYRMVEMCDRKRKWKTAVHRIVGLAFIPNPEGKPQINHKDGTRTNNHVSNLEWVTVSENHLHKTRVLGHDIGSKRSSSKLTENDIPAIFEARKTGKTMALIGAQFGVNKSIICDILLGRAWLHALPNAARTNSP
jgi:hypothetical protein